MLTGSKVYPNLAKGLEVTGLNQLWISDITYIRMPRGFIYLAAVIDLFSRKCVGWAIGKNIDTPVGNDYKERLIRKWFDEIVKEDDPPHWHLRAY